MMMEPVPDCLACAVRQLTEGTPEAWNPQEEGENISGVVLKVGRHATPFGGTVPFVDLWGGGMDRTRVIAYPAHLAGQLTNREAKIGDRVSIVYKGRKRVERGRHAGQDCKMFQVTVERGHH